MGFERDFDATELRLGLPGSESKINQTAPIPAKTNKRSFHEISQEESTGSRDNDQSLSDGKLDKLVQENAPPSKAQVVGWPPVRSYMKNCLQAKKMDHGGEAGGIFVKVSMDGAPYLRKMDLKVYKGYPELFKALENMFKFQIGKNLENYVPTYEDKDGDWMLVGDVPWDMFINSCKRLRIMKGSEAKGLGCAL